MPIDPSALVEHCRVDLIHLGGEAAQQCRHLAEGALADLGAEPDCFGAGIFVLHRGRWSTIRMTNAAPQAKSCHEHLQSFDQWVAYRSDPITEGFLGCLVSWSRFKQMGEMQPERSYAGRIVVDRRCSALLAGHPRRLRQSAGRIKHLNLLDRKQRPIVRRRSCSRSRAWSGSPAAMRHRDLRSHLVDPGVG